MICQGFLFDLIYFATWLTFSDELVHFNLRCKEIHKTTTYVIDIAKE